MTMNEKIKVSIVIIGYNDEKHYKKAISSCLKQTLKEIEIICVDDASTDETAKLLNQLAAKDKRIVPLVLETNMGCFGARYEGVKISKGDYILFLDSDDTIEPNACEIAYKKIVDESADIVQFGTNIVIPKEVFNPKDYQDTIDYFEKVLDTTATLPYLKNKTKFINYTFVEKKYAWNVWAKLYSSQLLKKIYMNYEGERIVHSEDMLLSFMTIIYATKIVRCHERLYNYSIGVGVSTNKDERKFKSDSQIDNFVSQFQVYTLIKKWLINDGFSKSLVDKETKVIKDKIVLELLYALFYNCNESSKSKFADQILKYCPKDIFVNELVRYVFDLREIEPKNAIYQIRDSEFLKSRKTQAKTIGMFYHRLYNGGVERVMSLLASIWESAGYNVVVITEENQTNKDYKLPETTKRVVLGNQFFNPVDRAERLRTVLRDNNIDIMVYHSWVGQDLLLDSFVTKAEGIPFIVHAHNNFTLPFSDSYFYDNSLSMQHKTYCLMDLIVTLSNVDYKWWSSMGYDVKKVNNPITYDIQKINKSNLNTNTVLYVGRLAPEKQYFEIFKVAEKVHEYDKNVKFVLVGAFDNSTDEKEAQKYLKDNKLSDVVLLEGFKKDVIKYYENSSIYLSTSQVEGFPMTFIEAKIHGLPIVAYELNNIDFLNEEDGAITVKQLDYQEAANAILLLLKDKKYIREMSRKSRTSVEKMYETKLDIVWKGIFDDVINKNKNLSDALTIRMMNNFMNTLEEYIEKGRFNQVQVIQQTSSFNTEYYEVIHSTSWKIGRIVTYIPRQIKDIIIISKNEGLNEALKHIEYKIVSFKSVIKNYLSR